MEAVVSEKAKVVILTGASSGIGEATARHLSRLGHHLFIGARRLEKLTALEAELRAKGGNIDAMALDVTRPEDLQRIVAKAQAKHGHIDVLINNAGVMPLSPLAAMTLTEWNQVMAVNATGAFLFSREAMRPMMAAKSGAIVNIGSYACYQSFPGIAAYAASKGALAQLTRTLALEAIDHGIRVNAVGSGDAVTNITNTLQPDGQAYLAEHGRKAPIGRAAHPNEIAEVAAFLASDRASYIVGAVVMADGGMSVVIQ
ncbi:SDR family oxidoreductase [Pectobacteriaceae bacterium CE90]|nr:SDR family oxidoreductase [Pectobacteriaceae bacterium CE90]